MKINEIIVEQQVNEVDWYGLGRRAAQAVKGAASSVRTAAGRAADYVQTKDVRRDLRIHAEELYKEWLKQVEIDKRSSVAIDPARLKQWTEDRLKVTLPNLPAGMQRAQVMQYLENSWATKYAAWDQERSLPAGLATEYPTEDIASMRVLDRNNKEHIVKFTLAPTPTWTDSAGSAISDVRTIEILNKMALATKKPTPAQPVPAMMADYPLRDTSVNAQVGAEIKKFNYVAASQSWSDAATGAPISNAAWIDSLNKIAAKATGVIVFGGVSYYPGDPDYDRIKAIIGGTP